MTVTREQALELLQTRYYDGIDRGDMTLAVSALHPDVEWSHAQVWAHHEFERAEASAYHGRDEIEAFLLARRRQLADSGITHAVVDLVLEGDRGAFRGEVTGPDRTTKLPFLVWVEFTDGLISRYDLRPL